MKIPFNEPNAVGRITARLKELIPQSREVYFACVGTDRSTGDALGPIIGSNLTLAGVPNVIGTIEDTLNAMNLERVSRERLPEGAFVIAIDACLGQFSSVGCIQANEGPIRPGAGINKELPPVGDMHITGVVNVGGFMEYSVLQNTRLNLVVKLADVITDAILEAYPVRIESEPTEPVNFFQFVAAGFSA